MKRKKVSPLSVAISAQLAFAMAATPAVFAQESDEKSFEEVVVTGSRAAPRSVFDSTAPIDVIGGDDFANQGDTDLVNLLRNVVPSYNVNTQPISDAATLVRPANMRGLAPDHTLVLVNGKRRHRASVIYWLGNGVSDGAQGPDISPIPAIALKQVEVLRDGAAAQYGSDAIAGVMNFQLKDSSEGGSLEVKVGEFYEGDGGQATVSANIGLPLTENGFANFSFEYGSSDATDRSVQRDDAQALIDAGNTAVAVPAQIWGQPEIKEDVKLFGNLGLELGDDKEAYAFGNYARKEVEGGFYFRNPDTRSAVFGSALNNVDATGAAIVDANGDTVPLHYDNDTGALIPVADMLDASGVLLGTLPGTRRYDRLVGDLTDDNSGACPQTGIDGTGGLDVRDSAGLAAVIADPNCFVFNEIFPGGFTPRFGGKVTDFAGTAGVRKVTDSGWSWDVSAAVGFNEADFFISNTVNASLGPATPTTFDPGKYAQFDKAFNIDVSKGFDVGFASDLNVAGGFEWRTEEFEITVGDPTSYEIGSLAAQGFSAAANGFPGFSPLAAGSWSRSNIAAYVDLEANITDNWLLGVAGRWEDFQDFGTTTNGKIATNLQIIEPISIRASYSTGFRAPTPGQSNAFNVSTEFDFTLNDLVNNGTIPSTNPVAQLRGGVPLDAEESVNYTAGVIFQFENLDITIDYFSIELEDRLAVSQNFSLTQAEIDDLLASGVTSAGNLQNFRFFTNDFDTTTTGYDIVATWSTDMLGGDTDVSLAYNYTETEVDAFTPEIIDATRIRELEEGLPDTRWNITGIHNVNDWRFMTRLSYFGEFYDSEDGNTYGDEYIVDVEVAHSFMENYTVVLGAQNVLDEFPDENPGAASGVGNLYSQFAPTGFGGGFYYMRFKYDF